MTDEPARDGAGRGRSTRLSVRVVGVLGLVVFGAAAVYAGRAVPVLWAVPRYAEHWQQRAQEDGELLYVALGDSAAQGIGASSPERGYVGLVAAELEARSGRSVRVVNLSVSGARVADVLGEQLPALEAFEPDVVTLAIGGNDAGPTAPEDFRRDFTEVVAALPAGSYVADVPDFQGGPRLESARALSAVARDVLAGQPHVVPVELEASTHAMTWGDYSGDLFHPGDSGYRLWAEPFLDVIDLGVSPGPQPDPAPERTTDETS